MSEERLVFGIEKNSKEMHRLMIDGDCVSYEIETVIVDGWIQADFFNKGLFTQNEWHLKENGPLTFVDPTTLIPSKIYDVRISSHQYKAALFNCVLFPPSCESCPRLGRLNFKIIE